jgi:hypothetical protein
MCRAFHSIFIFQLAVGINDINIPIGGCTTQPVTLDMTLQLWGITDASVRKDIHSVLRSTGEKLMMELMKQEELLTAEERGGVACQTDLVGRCHRPWENIPQLSFSHPYFIVVIKMKEKHVKILFLS